MSTALPAEHPLWLAVTLPPDPRMALVVRDLAARIARQVGCEGDDADAFGGILVEAVTQAIAHAGESGGAIRVEVLFRIDGAAFEVTLLLRADDERTEAALAATEPQAIWPVDVLSQLTGRFEIWRDSEGCRCRVTRPLSTMGVKDRPERAGSGC
jgi:two-component sensor histidine kinase